MQLARAARRQWQRFTDDGRPTASPLPESGHRVTLQRRALPSLPVGTTFDRIGDDLRTLGIDGSPTGELAAYVDDALWRFLHTVDLLRGYEGKALELGANPYFITWLLRQESALDLTLANYFGRPNGTYEQHVELTWQGTRTGFVATYDHFNLEADLFPYSDGQFDVVVFCEIIEHLTNDPVRVLREINRILVPGGTLVLTTPNVCRLGNVLAMVEGRNIYDPYSAYGPYGRHNREYNPHELSLLLRHAGFEYDRLFTADAHADVLYDHPLVAELAPSLVHRQADLGQYVFVRATKTSTPHAGLPSFLYRSYKTEQIVSCE